MAKAALLNINEVLLTLLVWPSKDKSSSYIAKSLAIFALFSIACINFFFAFLLFASTKRIWIYIYGYYIFELIALKMSLFDVPSLIIFVNKIYKFSLLF